MMTGAAGRIGDALHFIETIPAMMKSSGIYPMVNKTTISILKVLSYFDLFNYPVSSREIYFFLDSKVEFEDLSSSLDQLTALGCLFKFDSFYSLRNTAAVLEDRINGTRRAEKLLVRARRISNFLYWFPFVRAICISGSLSKHIADERADIDYFIITSPNRLWIARTFMHGLKKLSFLTGHEHMLCMNYYLDEEAISIEEKNIFTATELVTLLPVCGNGTLDRFFGGNAWVKRYFPNQAGTDSSYLAKERNPWIKRFMEFLLRNRFGNKLDNYFMQLTSSRWKQKEIEERRNYKGERMGLRTSKHFSKPNPELFQHKILQSFENNFREWKTTWVRRLETEQSTGFSERNDIVIANPVPGPVVS